MKIKLQTTNQKTTKIQQFFKILEELIEVVFAILLRKGNDKIVDEIIDLSKASLKFALCFKEDISLNVKQNNSKNEKRGYHE